MAGIPNLPVNVQCPYLFPQNYETEQQQRRINYCADLIAQQWISNRCDFPVHETVSQILHLLSDRFNIETAETRIAEQMRAFELSASEEIEASLPWLDSAAVNDLIKAVTSIIEAFVSNACEKAPAEGDFSLVTQEITRLLIKNRYLLVQNNLAKDQNRRRKRWLNPTKNDGNTG